MECVGRLLTLWRPAFGCRSLEPKLAGGLPLQVAAKAALSRSHRQADHQGIGRSAGTSHQAVGRDHPGWWSGASRPGGFARILGERPAFNGNL